MADNIKRANKSDPHLAWIIYQKISKMFRETNNNEINARDYPLYPTQDI